MADLPEVGVSPGPPQRERVACRPHHAARARRCVRCDRAGDGGRPVPHELQLDHPRVRGSRRGPLRPRRARAVRVGVDADAHRLAALVHPRVPPAHQEGGSQGGGRDHSQPPLPGRLAHAGHRGRGADPVGGRADRLRRRDGARARRRRLVSGHQRRLVRHVRRVQDLQRAQVVQRGRAQRGSRQDGLRQRAHGDHEPRRHERDDGRLHPRPRPLLPPAREVRAGRLHVVGLRLDGLLREAAARRDLEAPGRRVRRSYGVARRRRPQPRRAPAGGDEDRRPGRSHHDRPDRLERRGADGLQRAHSRDRCSSGRTSRSARCCSTRTGSTSRCRRTTGSSAA